MRFIQTIAIAWVVVLMALVAVELVYFAFATTYELYGWRGPASAVVFLMTLAAIGIVSGLDP